MKDMWDKFSVGVKDIMTYGSRDSFVIYHY